MINRIKNNKTIFILLGIIILSSVWLLTKGMPFGDDTAFHFDRIISLAKTIKNGDFIALIHDHYYGYGYATGLFYSNFYFYIPAILNNIGLSNMASFKVLFLFINIFTTIITYKCLKSIIDSKKIAIIGTIIYMFSNYRIVDIYARCAIGEILAFMIIPIVILGIYEILYRDYKKWYLFSIGFVLLLLAHLITTVLMGIVVFIIICVNYKKLSEKNRLKYLIVSILIGVLLGLFFVVPIINQIFNGNISVFADDYKNVVPFYLLPLKDFLIPTGFSNKHLGFVLILLLPIRYLVKKKNIKEKELLMFADIFYIIGIISWLLTIIFPFGETLSFIQFSWRFLIISTVFLVFSYAIYFKLIGKNKLLKYIYIFIITFSLLEVSIYSFQYGFRTLNHNSFSSDNIGTGEYLIHNTNTSELDLENPKIITNNPDLNIDYTKKGTSITIKYKNNKKKNTYILLPLFNYYGYKCDKIDISNGTNNLIRLNLNKETDTLKVSYKISSIEKVSYLISSLTCVGLIIYIIKERRR